MSPEPPFGTRFPFPLAEADWELFQAEVEYDNLVAQALDPYDRYWSVRADARANWLACDDYVMWLVRHRWDDGQNLGNVAAYAEEAGFYLS